MLTDGLQLLGSTAELLVERLASVSPFLLAAALLLHLGKVVTRARAWHNITRAAYPEERLCYRHALGAYLCGIGVNSVLPARPGELLKLTLVKRRAPGTKLRGLASTLVTESAFDTVTGAAALTFGIVVGWTSLGGSLAPSLGPLAGHPWIVAAAALALTAAVCFAWRPLGGRLRGVAAEAARGFAIFGDPRRYLRTVVSWQLVALVLRLGSIGFFLAAFHLPASLRATLLVLAVQSAANLIPLTPGGAGAQQALLVVALGSGATTSAIVRFGAGAQLVTAVLEVVLALASLALMTGSLRWRRLVTAEQAVATRPSGASTAA